MGSLPRIEVSTVDGAQEDHRSRGLFGRLSFLSRSGRKDNAEKGENGNDTKNGTSLHVEVDEKNFWSSEETLERPPLAEHYRSLDTECSGNMLTPGENIYSRPSMRDLMESDTIDSNVPGQTNIEAGEHKEPLKEFESSSGQKLRLGWMEGVLMRCLLDILGVMLFLRITWVSAQAGVLLGTVIVLLSALVTSLTTISMCSICTNGEVKGGGMYFMISRSLGPEFGGSIGMLFSFAYAVAAAMHLVGLAETIRDIMKEHGWAIFDNGLNDVRVIGLVTCTIWMGSVFAGTAFVSKTQIALLVILTVSLLDYWIGAFLPVTAPESRKGITGVSLQTLSENMGPSWRDGHNFFSIFAIFFPACSGIMAGANISGDLKDPSSAIPKGTLSAIAITTALYLGIIWTGGMTSVRDASGDGPLWNINNTYDLYHPPCAANNSCPYGSANFFQVMEAESIWGPLITAGIFAATLSSALSALVSSPKVFQAVCRDRIFPKIEWFGKGYGKDDDPYRAYTLVYGIAMCFILIADLNVIAPIISNFFLAAFALVNYACFDASLSRSIGFRPTFKYYNKWVSLAGAALCLFVMFISDWKTALMTFVCFAILFMYIKHRKPDVNWGSSVHANNYRTALSSILRLTNTVEHVKNYRPQLLVLTGNPVARTPLVDFAYSITKGNSLMICGHVVPYTPADGVFSCVRQMDKRFNEWLRKRKVKAFYYPVDNPNVRTGAHTLMLTAGLGKMRPNVLMLGFKNNWHEKGLHGLGEIRDYIGTIRDAFENNMGLLILSSPKWGLDMSQLIERVDLADISKLQLPNGKSRSNNSSNSVSREPSRSDLESMYAMTPPITPTPSRSPTVKEGSNFGFHLQLPNIHKGAKRKNTLSVDNLAFVLGEMEQENPALSRSQEAKINKVEHATDASASISEAQGTSAVDDHPNFNVNNLMAMQNKFMQFMTAKMELTSVINRFKTKVKHAVIDVWWLYDDGGLTLLIPYLLTQHKSFLEGAKLRIFTIASSHATVVKEQRRMADLLSQFRIHCSEVFVLPDISKPPKESTIAEFEALIEPFRATTDFYEGQIRDVELETQRNRTNRQLRCREMLLQYSTEADLIVMTMPVPRRKHVSSSLYMAWLHMLTHELPPTLLVRGNQTSVLTVYS